MITQHLVCHPTSPCAFVDGLTVDIVFSKDTGLRLTYRLQADLQSIIVPEQQTPAATDGLWEHTCFEAFIAAENGTDYQEFNFSPSQQWAVYLFSDYRVRNHWQSDYNYRIIVEQTSNALCVDVLIPLSELPLLNNNQPLKIGLTTVIEAADGSRSYWALQHPAATPDFHHHAGFTCTLDTDSI